jgi:hypothetical protein
LDKEQIAVACFFAKKITHKFLSFWFDERRESINIWSDGRATDSYRGKNRILGENFSLLYQHIYCQREWEKCSCYSDSQAGYNGYLAWVNKMPSIKVTDFNISTCHYTVITFRNGDLIINIPLVNGERHYNQAVYQPIPFAIPQIGAIPDYFKPIFRGIIRLAGGDQYIAYPCYRDIEISGDAKELRISFSSFRLAKIGSKLPEQSIECEHYTNYRIIKDKITAKEIWIFKDSQSVDEVEILMSMPKGFSEQCISADGDNNCSNKIRVFEDGNKVLNPSGTFVSTVDGTEQKYEVYRYQFAPCDQKKFALAWEYNF